MTPPTPTDDPFRAETAGHHLVPVLVATEDERADDVLARLVARGPEHHDTIHIVDAAGRSSGVVRLLALVAAKPDTRIAELAISTPSVHRDDDQEVVARLALENELSEVPVIDSGGKLLGAVPALALLAILRAEHHEDLDRLAGLGREQARAIGALTERPVRRLRRRVPWLVVGLAGSVGGALAATRFEAVVGSNVALAFFLPTVIYLADAISTQTEAVVVRGLSATAKPRIAIIAGELATGTLLGIVLAALAMPVVYAVSGAAIAVTVAVALVAAAVIATTISLALAFGLDRIGVDPAYGAGPLGTVVQDVASMLVYLGVALVIMQP